MYSEQWMVVLPIRNALIRGLWLFALNYWIPYRRNEKTNSTQFIFAIEVVSSKRSRKER